MENDTVRNQCTHSPSGEALPVRRIVPPGHVAEKWDRAGTEARIIYSRLAV
jgi:hypothetical protein